MPFPRNRPRRLRSSAVMRRAVRETRLAAEDFVYPLFACPGEGVKKEVGAMPGKYQMSVDRIVEECREVQSLGIPGVILFGLPESKDTEASGAYDDDGIIQRAMRAIKAEVQDLLVIADCCLCEYTSHGHCGRVVDNDVDNDSTLELLSKTALSQARAGADIIAPSDMMDGRVGAIRETLDDNGFSNLPILSYAAKYASGFYGPFREAADSAPQFGDRNSYQMDPANQREAMREIELDIEEGRGHDHGEAGDAVPRRHLPRQAGVRLAGGGLSGQRGILDDRRGGAKRLDRSAARDDGVADGDQARRGGLDSDLLRERCRASSLVVVPGGAG